MADKIVKKGDTIKVDYVGKLKDGEIFDVSTEEEAKKAGIFSDKRPYAPLMFKVGAGEMIPGFDAQVEGMKLGETKDIVIKPEDAYGPRKEELVKTIPKKMFGDKVPELKEGMRLVMQTPNGPLIAKVVKIEEENITLDLNHDLAGKELHFKVTIKEIETETK